jgi:hypothetical protein
MSAKAAKSVRKRKLEADEMLRTNPDIDTERVKVATGLDGHTIAGLRRKYQHVGLFRRPDDTPSIAQVAPYESPAFTESMRQTDENLRRINETLAARGGEGSSAQVRGYIPVEFGKGVTVQVSPMTALRFSIVKGIIEKRGEVVPGGFSEFIDQCVEDWCAMKGIVVGGIDSTGSS